MNYLKEFIIGSSAPVFFHWFIATLIFGQILPFNITYQHYVILIPLLLGVFRVLTEKFGTEFIGILLLFLLAVSKARNFVILTISLGLSWFIGNIIAEYYNTNELFKAAIIGMSGLITMFSFIRIAHFITHDCGVKVNYTFISFTFFEPILLAIDSFVIKFALLQGLENARLLLRIVNAILWFGYVYVLNAYSYNTFSDRFYHLISFFMGHLGIWLSLMPYMETNS